MAQISFDYNNVINKAKDLDNIATAMQNQTCKEIEEIIKNIEASWSGDSEKLFVTYLSNVSEHVKNQAKYLTQCAEYLRASAKKMQQAESSVEGAIQKI